ncbi:sugar ABC transporter substrate-binding protein [Streptacidiphilus sp. PB12-B1b]|uniref:sugar ABC transporter substrate-binding protein n=1 Tax=Streptacidiphilus sp. PB12-B1b TaxID=2705012 RepID=UPI0015FD3086|nr:substrate-binding domain-containing protein [Streptacidiphilus sp. PB12-B1b]QMU78653.1 sugar ABC transporter substrate-binding protein [Streptacidiphilus sp. PB12-B1b]
MNTTLRRTVVATAAVSMALGMAACGKAGSSSSSSSASSSASGGSSAAAGGAIGLLLPDNVTARYAAFDKPQITAEIKTLCSTCTVDYANAAGSAATQAQQMSTMVANGDKVIILDAEDGAGIKSTVQAAVNKGVKVVAYDRLAEGPVSAYVSYDNEKVGELQGAALLTALGAKAVPSTKIVEIDGAASDPNAAQFKAGFQEAVKGKVDIAYDQSGNWDAPTANQETTAAIQQLGKANVAAVYSANDGMAAGVAAALKGAGLSGIPLTGQDAQIDGIQRILAGTQYVTIYKAPTPEAQAAAKLAVALLNGTPAVNTIATGTQTSGSGNTVPSLLLTPVAVTKSNVESVIVKGGLYTPAQICTPEFKADCTANGIQ